LTKSSQTFVSLTKFYIIKFPDAQEEQKAKKISPDVTTYFIKNKPNTYHCVAFFGCYWETYGEVMTHLKRVENLPEDKDTYIKIKTNPKTEKFTTDISKKSSADFDVYKKV